MRLGDTIIMTYLEAIRKFFQPARGQNREFCNTLKRLLKLFQGDLVRMRQVLRALT